MWDLFQGSHTENFASRCAKKQDAPKDQRILRMAKPISYLKIPYLALVTGYLFPAQSNFILVEKEVNWCFPSLKGKNKYAGSKEDIKHHPFKIGLQALRHFQLQYQYNSCMILLLPKPMIPTIPSTHDPYY